MSQMGQLRRFSDVRDKSVHPSTTDIFRLRWDGSFVPVADLLRPRTYAVSKFSLIGGGGLRTYISFTDDAGFLVRLSGAFPLMNPSAKIAFVFFVILASPTASFARASGQEEAAGHLRVVQPNVAATNALDNMSVDPSGIGNASKLAPIPRPRIYVPTIPHFK